MIILKIVLSFTFLGRLETLQVLTHLSLSLGSGAESLRADVQRLWRHGSSTPTFSRFRARSMLVVPSGRRATWNPDWHRGLRPFFFRSLFLEAHAESQRRWGSGRRGPRCPGPALLPQALLAPASPFPRAPTPRPSPSSQLLTLEERIHRSGRWPQLGAGWLGDEKGLERSGMEPKRQA